MAKNLHDELYDRMEGDAMRRPVQVAWNRSLKYANFRRSMYWIYVREQVYLSYRGRYHCTMCTRRDLPVDVHHKTYEHYGDELNHLEDLTLLCRECHQKVHGRPE